MWKRDRDPLDLRLPRLVVELRVQSLGHDLQAWMQTLGWMKMRKTCSTRGRSGVNRVRPAQC